LHRHERATGALVLRGGYAATSFGCGPTARNPGKNAQKNRVVLLSRTEGARQSARRGRTGGKAAGRFVLTDLSAVATAGLPFPESRDETRFPATATGTSPFGRWPFQ